MRHFVIVIVVVFFASSVISAQNDYSPCYTNNMAQGDAAFKQGKYSTAKTYYATAKKCAGGNPSMAQQKINACDAKMKAQQQSEEAKLKERQSVEENERKAEEAKQRAEQVALEEKRKSEWEEKKAREKAEKEKEREKEQEKLREAEIADRNDAQRLASLACPSQPVVKDYDGNQYRTVQIGSQCWMAENLRTTHYANGTAIRKGIDSSSSVAYYYYPDNNPNNVTRYGLLYNWRATMGQFNTSESNPSGVRGICPRGWHVPSKAEWIQLKEYVKSQDSYYCNGQSKYVAKALSSKIGWRYIYIDEMEDLDCFPFYNHKANNATGFSATPAGKYKGGDFYSLIGKYCFIWSSSQQEFFNKYVKSADSFVIDLPQPIIGGQDFSTGCSVRCVKD